MESLYYLKNLPDWHPILNYFREGQLVRKLIQELKLVDPRQESQKFYNILNHLSEIEKRFARKENELFPYLEKHGWHRPSTGMWTFHDNIRAQLKEIRLQFEAHELMNLKNLVDIALSEIERLLSIEEQRLFPNSIEMLEESEWKEMSYGEEEIGFMSSSEVQTLAAVSHADPLQNLSSAFLKMNEGQMTLDQINLMLQYIPFDLTYVDEQERVRFYNRGEERVFPRSAGVIGREVRFCHPPKSVDTVLRILEEFRAGRKDKADFWIQYRGKVIFISYYAIRDHDKNYRGVIEVSQDITEIQKLTGEKRLLDWDTQVSGQV